MRQCSHFIIPATLQLAVCVTLKARPNCRMCTRCSPGRPHLLDNFTYCECVSPTVGRCFGRHNVGGVGAQVARWINENAHVVNHVKIDWILFRSGRSWCRVARAHTDTHTPESEVARCQLCITIVAPHTATDLSVLFGDDSTYKWHTLTLDMSHCARTRILLRRIMRDVLPLARTRSIFPVGPIRWCEGTRTAQHLCVCFTLH